MLRGVRSGTSLAGSVQLRGYVTVRGRSGSKRTFDGLKSFSPRSVPESEVLRRMQQQDVEGLVEEATTRGVPAAVAQRRRQQQGAQFMRRWALHEALEGTSFMVQRMHPDTRNSYIRLARQDPLVAEELDLLAAQKAQTAGEAYGHGREAAALDAAVPALMDEIRRTEGGLLAHLTDRQVEADALSVHGDPLELSDAHFRRRQTQLQRERWAGHSTTSKSVASQDGVGGSAALYRRQEAAQASLRAAEKALSEEAAQLADDVEAGRSQWRDTNTMWDRRHAPETADGSSSATPKGTRWSWRPNYDAGAEAAKAHFRPVLDRVFRETPEAPVLAPTVVPPVAGDEELQAGEWDEEERPRLRHDVAKTGRSYLHFPAVHPTTNAVARRLAGEDGSSGVGSRKSARAHVRLSRRAPLGETAREDVRMAAEVSINGRPLAEYFSQWLYRDAVLHPLLVVERLNDFAVVAEVVGGGPAGQAEALRMALANALVHYDPAWRNVLKFALFLRRDPRRVQPKLAGRKKARKMKQWRKR